MAQRLERPDPPATQTPEPPAIPAADRREPAARLRTARRRRLFSPLTRRILTVNVLALGILVAGILYLARYQENLIQTELQSLNIQAEIFAAALGEGAHGTAADGGAIIRPEAARPILRRLVLPTGTRARLFSDDGTLIADSRVLSGPGGEVQVEELPPPDATALPGMLIRLYDTVIGRLPERQNLPVYRERAHQSLADYDEAVRALAGEAASRVRGDGGGGGGLVLSVAVPVQRFKQVLGVLMLTQTGEYIDEAVRDVRLDILRVFLVALGITVLLSLYLAGTIVRPLRRLAQAADRVRQARGRDHDIPEFRRDDEIGALAVDLRDMTNALRSRIDAIERFAADVAHEIKNPLSSLRSAVETAARVREPEQQRKLMAIILDDVERLNRLITDISDASRLDAELSRVAPERIDLGQLLAALVEVHRTAGAGSLHRIAFAEAPGGPFIVMGIESRLVQVFQNLLSNAFSFNPPGGTVTLTIGHRDGMIEAVVEDEGPGIPEGSLERIFDRFYSERPEGEPFGTHSGLGLSISRQIVEAQGGAIAAANRRDDSGRVGGARFTVRLPAA